MLIVIKKMRGGKRKGSGAPKKPPTKTINFRVPVDKAEFIKDVTRPVISKVIELSRQGFSNEEISRMLNI